LAGFITENHQSRPFTYSILDQSMTDRELLFDIQGTEDEAEVLSLMVGFAPSTYLGLLLRSFSAEPVGGGIWKGSAKYSGYANNNEYTFKTGGGTRHITQSLGTVNSYAPPGLTASDFGGAIGVTNDKVEGVDLPAPQFQWSETHVFADAAITDSYKFLLARFTGLTMNDDDFKGFAAGECALIDVSGGKRGFDQWVLTFSFAGSPNATGLTVGDITGIDKLGWDYLWIGYSEEEDAAGHALVQRPSAVYVERVLIPTDYSLLGIGV
jgi:hypothetical protein